MRKLRGSSARLAEAWKRIKPFYLVGLGFLIGIVAFQLAGPILASPDISVADFSKFSNVQSYNYLIFKDSGTYYAKNGETGAIDYSSTDLYTVLQSAIDAIDSGIILLKGDLGQLSDTVTTKPDVIIQGFGKDATVIMSPDNKPAFSYTQPSGATSVVHRPLVIRDMTIQLPTTENPQYAIKVDCSAYGGSKVTLENVEVYGRWVSGTYDKNSDTPHIGVEIINAWNWEIIGCNFQMAGVIIKTSSYGYITRCSFVGGANGDAIGVWATTCCTITATKLVTESNVRPVFYSSANGIAVHALKCHFFQSPF